MRRIVLFSIVVLVVLLVIWAPWLTRQYAEDKVIDQFNSIWDGVVDGCGFDCNGCGVIGAERTLLGYKVEAVLQRRETQGPTSADEAEESG